MCLQVTEIRRPLFCFAVMADSSGIVCVACLMSSFCVAPLFDWTWFHALCLRESSCWLSSGWVVLHGCGVKTALSVKTARVRWYPAFVWWRFGNLSARSHGVLQQPERAEVKKGKKGDGWSTQMC